jgi:hypothetical protein
MNDKNLNEWQEGAVDFYEGKELKDNPYNKITEHVSFVRWDMGWKKERERHYGEE